MCEGCSCRSGNKKRTRAVYVLLHLSLTLSFIIHISLGGAYAEADVVKREQTESMMCKKKKKKKKLWGMRLHVQYKAMFPFQTDTGKSFSVHAYPICLTRSVATLQAMSLCVSVCRGRQASYHPINPARGNRNCRYCTRGAFTVWLYSNHTQRRRGGHPVISHFLCDMQALIALCLASVLSRSQSCHANRLGDS